MATNLVNPISVLTAATAVNTTSGTAIDFTSIPSWVKRITLILNGVSTNAASGLLIQIGSGSISNTGYNSQYWNILGGNGVTTNGFAIGTTAGAPNALSGIVTLNLIGSNTWISASNLNFSNVTSTGFSGSGSSPALGGALDRVRLTTANGTDTFDAGSMNIFYE